VNTVDCPGVWGGSGSGHERPRALIAIDAMPYSVYVNTKYATTRKRLDERRDCAAAAGARAQAAVSTGQSGNPAGRRRGSRNKATLAAATLLDGEALGLTRRAVEAALAGDMLAMKLCLERVLPRCQERPVTFSLPSLAAIGNGEIDEPSPQNVSRAMNAVTTGWRAGRLRRARRQRSPGSTRPSCERPALPRRRSPAAICCRS
jgi:hypothetical protein